MKRSVFFSALCLGSSCLSIHAQELMDIPRHLIESISTDYLYDTPIPALPANFRTMSPQEHQAWEDQYALIDSNLPQLTQNTDAQLQLTLDESNKTNQLVNNFTKSNDITADKLPPTSLTTTPSEEAKTQEMPRPSVPPIGEIPPLTTSEEHAPLKINIDPTKDTIVDYDGGMYLDFFEKDIAILIKNVKIRGPQINLDCTKQLQIYFEDKKPSSKDKKTKTDSAQTAQVEEDKQEDDANPFSKLSQKFNNGKDVKKAIAFGNVYAEYKDKDGVWWQAHGERMTYDAHTGEVILSGGYPFIQEKNGTRLFKTVRESDTIRYFEGKVIHVGPAKAKISNLNTLSPDKKKNKKKPKK